MSTAITHADVGITIGSQEAKFIDLQYTDLSGNLKSIIIPGKYMPETLRSGAYFDGSSIEGCSQISSSDMLLRPDLSSISSPQIASSVPTAAIMCDICRNNEEAFEGAPRTLLKRALEVAARRGYKFTVGVELEFFIMIAEGGNIKPIDSLGYCSAQTSQRIDTITKNMMLLLADAGIQVRKLHHEVGVGQYEMVLNHGDALAIADQLTRAKHLLKQMAINEGFIITFMPKPIASQNGSGMHIHFSINNIKTNTNLFYDKTDDMLLSPLAGSFIEGVLSHAREITLFLNPTVNSFKRLLPGYEAPTFVCWGSKNRSAMIRRPEFDSPQAARAEVRSPDPQANPYLAFASLLHAGLDGIDRQLPLRAPVEESLFAMSNEELADKNVGSLPHSLADALACAQESAFVRTAFPETLCSQLFKAKTQEVSDFSVAITDWECNKYL